MSTYQERLTVFRKNFDKALEEIAYFLKPTSYEPRMHELVKWMLETDANPYSYLPSDWGEALENAQLFVELLHLIHHALYDDGDICFVSVNGQPRIVFHDPHDIGIHRSALTEQERYALEQFGRRHEVEILDIQPNDFGSTYDAFAAKERRKCP